MTELDEARAAVDKAVENHAELAMVNGMPDIPGWVLYKQARAAFEREVRIDTLMRESGHRRKDCEAIWDDIERVERLEAEA